MLFFKNIKYIITFAILFSNNAFSSENDKEYISKVFLGENKFLEYFPDKNILNVDDWLILTNSHCGKKPCQKAFYRFIVYDDGTRVKEKIISNQKPINEWKKDNLNKKNTNYILKLYSGKNSAKKHFPDKTIKLVDKWFIENNAGCTNIEKTVPHGKTSKTIIAGQNCKKIMVRFIYYTDGTVVKEKRIANNKNIW